MKVAKTTDYDNNKNELIQFSKCWKSIFLKNYFHSYKGKNLKYYFLILVILFILFTTLDMTDFLILYFKSIIR